MDTFSVSNRAVIITCTSGIDGIHFAISYEHDINTNTVNLLGHPVFPLIEEYDIKPCIKTRPIVEVPHNPAHICKLSPKQSKQFKRGR
jgi:hypothetical protein